MEKTLSPWLVNLPSNLVEKIGEGGSANVYKIAMKEQDVAVKLWKQQQRKGKVLIVSNQLRKLCSPNVVNFIGFSIRPSAIIYEYCHLTIDDEDVTNLSQLIDVWNDMFCFDFYQRVSLLQQAANGLTYLHERDIIHQDFKTTNLLVSGSPSNIIVKITDFDEMFFIKNTIMHTQTGTNSLKGMTLTYTAPELCNQAIKTANKISDVYSWAVTAFEIITGLQPPWKNVIPILNDALFLEAIRRGERPSLDEADGKYQSEDQNLAIIKTLVNNAWESEPQERSTIHKVIYNYYLIIKE